MRKFSEGPALSIGPFLKVQLEVIFNFYVVRKNETETVGPCLVQKLKWAGGKGGGGGMAPLPPAPSGYTPVHGE